MGVSCDRTCVCAACAVYFRSTSEAHVRSRVVHVSDLGFFCDGDAVRSRCFALRDASRKDSVTPLPPVTLCRPTSGAWQGDSRALALLTLPGEKKTTLGRGLL